MAFSAPLRAAARRGWKAATGQVSIGPGEPIVGVVDSPKPFQQYSHWVNVTGWACARDGSPLKLRVTAGGHVVAELAPSVPRPDVASVLPDLPNASVSGFDIAVPATSLTGWPFSVIRVDVETTGASPIRRRLGFAPVVHARGRLLALPRAAYQKVWDRSARNLTAARLAVAGYADDAEWNRSGIASAEHLTKVTSITSSDVVLEIGCGAGRVGAKLAPSCREWIGCDVSPNMLAFARTALDGLGYTNTKLVQLNGIDLHGIPDASVDVVYCTAVFMHLDEWERYRYITDAKRVLRPGGRIYFDNFDLDSPQGWALFEEVARLDPATRPPNVSRSSTGEELRTYVTRAGFEAIAIDRYPLWVTVTGRKPAAPPK
jgi:SAM-dependent methyltransferase